MPPYDILNAEPPVFRAVRHERKRTYIFPGGDGITVECVCNIAISERGTHRLETTAGEKFIIKPGWLAIEIDSNEWEF